MQLRETLLEAESIVTFLISEGLADAFNFPYQSANEVTFTNSHKLSLALKARPYSDVYFDLVTEGVYTVKLPDAALLQMSYLWEEGQLIRHRLAYMPNPDLISFQEEPELYEDDSLYADMTIRSSVIVPLRFDFDSGADVVEEVWHPVSHLTLGSFENCRIAVSSAVPPAHFVAFVLKAFYGRKMKEIHSRLPPGMYAAGAPKPLRTITAMEQQLLFFSVPGV